MDVQMPVMSGLEATTAIHERDSYARHVPIIALTANALPEDWAACMAAGMDDYVSKPVRRARLCEVVFRWLSEAARAVEDDTSEQTIFAHWTIAQCRHYSWRHFWFDRRVFANYRRTLGGASARP